MSLMIPGPVGALEAAARGRTSQREQWIVICHPHPQFGGSMENNVVNAVAEAAEAHGYGVLTFNFRGVGRSDGERGDGREQVDDLLAAMTYIDDEYDCPQPHLVVAGYSFGAAVAAHALPQGIAPRANLWVSPPIGVTKLPAEALNWLGAKTIFCGEHDEYCPASEAADLCAGAKPPITFRTIPEANHFYPGFEGALTEATAEFLQGLSPVDR